jgi:hypothetical protein
MAKKMPEPMVTSLPIFEEEGAVTAVVVRSTEYQLQTRSQTKAHERVCINMFTFGHLLTDEAPCNIPGMSCHMVQILIQTACMLKFCPAWRGTLENQHSCGVEITESRPVQSKCAKAGAKN